MANVKKEEGVELRRSLSSRKKASSPGGKGIEEPGLARTYRGAGGLLEKGRGL